MSIFVIRHGNIFASSAEARRGGAGTDIPLVDSGMAQAQRLASYFAARSLVMVCLYSGPLLRARQTAAPIAAALDHPVDAILPWLDEIDHGPDEGQPEATVVARLQSGDRRLGPGWDRARWLDGRCALPHRCLARLVRR